MGMKKDKYRINHAEICIRCEKVNIRKSGKIRGCLCPRCWNELQELFDNWNTNGLYLTTKEDKCNLINPKKR